MRPQPARARWPRDRSSGGPAERGLILLGAVGLLAAIVGLVVWVGRDTGKRPVRLLEAYDISGSVSPQEKQEYCAVAEATHNRALPPQARVMVWAFARAAWELYQGTPLEAKDLRPLLDRISGSAATGRGTSPALVLERIWQEARHAEDAREDVAILLVWDGEDHDAAATRPVVQRLASLTNLRAIWVVGVPLDPGRGKDLRSNVRRTFRPLTTPLIISGEFDRQSGLDAFQRAVLGE